MKRRSWMVVGLWCLLAVGLAFGTDEAKDDKGKAARKKGKAKDKQEQKQELDLKDLLPEKSLFGPSASQTAFSFDGRYGAYLYRPYKERRHGNDLYLYDVEKDQITRITWPSVMARFQKDARKVVEDRIEKAKKAKSGDDDEKQEQDADGDEWDGGKKKRRKKESSDPVQDPNQGEKDADEQSEEQKGEETKDAEQVLKDRGDWVSDKDADEEKAPRYRGISRFEWSPTGHEILLESEGDLYRYALDSNDVTRLTQTRSHESSVQWLPDGKGYTFRRNGSLYRVRPGDTLPRQLDPKFGDGESLVRYRISPDGSCLAFLTSRQTENGSSSKVEIANYRDRMMKAKEVSRHVSDDPLPTYERRIYLYRLSEDGDEEDVLSEVFKGQTHMPDDMVKAPVWSPDSKKIAFFTFEQDPAIVKIFEANVPEAAAEKARDDGEAGEEAKDSDADVDQDESDADADKDAEASDKDEEAKPEQAREIFRFLHYGGPNTPRMMELYYLADNRRLVYMSEQTGFRHLHRLDPRYESFEPLTSGPYEVYPIDISKDRKWVFVRATKEHPSQTDVYKVSTANGKMVRLTREVGTHTEVAVSEDGAKVLTNRVSYDELKELLFIDCKAGVCKALTDSHSEKAHAFAKPSPEFFDFENRHGQKLYGMMFKSDDWSEKDQRPVLIYFYGGPLGTRKMVVQGSFSPYNYAFPYYMANKHGYVACTIDTRGNSGYGGVFEKANFQQVGKPQVEDLVDAVNYLVEQGGVSRDKVAIHGWSFGGFQTQMCMYTEPDVFKVGIAGAGPTEWENYNSWYTRHTIGKSEPGKATLKEFSLLPLAKNLKGHLLLVHGMEDSNVLYQDTVRVYRELLKAGKETLVELFLDPTGGHGLGGDVKTLSRYRKYEQFLLRTLGAYEAADPKQEKRRRRQERKERQKDNGALAMSD